MNFANAQLLRGIGVFLAVSWVIFALRIAWQVSRAEPQARGAALRQFALGILAIAVVSLFVGVVFWTIGMGAIFPDIIRIGAPLACPDGLLELASISYSYKPGQSGVTRTFLCTLANGDRQDITGAMIFHAGLIYSVLLLTVLLWLGKPDLRVLHLRQPRRAGASAGDTTARLHRELQACLARRDGSANGELPARDPAARLRQLQTLRDAGLITASEFDAKRAEVLREL